ncbi:hypothetical protein LZD49_32425 [Dyadobacter sp. CY261]|uniref:hypothetical protein n=1 Tax=Dyadobacter sp. CY261 TaxID=2907203 RepID=UPI001F3D9899|nr:hypothetical protein [Dyadobacter sp. CY261]MCF0075234.1 hypothetical protein [Dyadobacter sp. CY261]
MSKFSIPEFFRPKNGVYFWMTIWPLAAFVGTWFILKFQNLIEHKAAMLWMTGLALASAVLGMVFAIPKILSAEPDSSKQQNTRKLLQENTNLFQISDWLTKTIVGAGLVEMKSIPSYVLKVATRMSEGIALKGNVLGARSFCAGIIVYALSMGFIVGYLITRLIINRILDDQ